MSPRYLVSNILQYSGLNAAATALRRGSLAVLCYHRVLDVSDASRSSVDPAITTSLHVFERQMEALARRFRPITLSETMQVLQRQGAFSPGSVLVTFDDGTADTYTNAFPVMSLLGIPGVVFLATGFIGTPERHWADVVHEQVAAQSDRSTATQVVERLKRMPSVRRRELVESMTAAGSSTSADNIRNLTWDQVEEMRRHGFEFGSHTRNHVILPHETNKTIREELEAADDDLRSHLGHRPSVFAYPDGQFDERSMQLVEESGCRAAFTCDEGFACKKTHSLALPRLLVHDGVSATPAGNFSAAMFLTHLAGTIPRRYRRTG